MADRTREESEERVLAAVKEWLPTLRPGEQIDVQACDPDTNEHGAHFTVGKITTFACCGPDPAKWELV